MTTSPHRLVSPRAGWPVCLGALGLLLAASGLAAQTATSATAVARPVLRSALPAPDAELFDGSKFPPEERPERGILSTIEVAGNEPQPGRTGEQRGGGGREEEREGQGGGMAGVGPRPAGAPEEQTPEAAEIAALGGGGPEFEGIETADAAGGGGPPPPAGGLPTDEELDNKPQPIPLGDRSAQIAMRTDSRDPNINRAPAANERSEERMAVRSAAGQQTPNRTRGSERGIDMPSDL